MGQVNTDRSELFCSAVEGTPTTLMNVYSLAFEIM